MAEKIDDKMLDYVEILAKLELTGEERENVRQDMEKMLQYMDLLKELDTDRTEALSHVFRVSNVFREDEVKGSGLEKAILSCAPEVKDGCLKVPKTVE